MVSPTGKVEEGSCTIEVKFLIEPVLAELRNLWNNLRIGGSGRETVLGERSYMVVRNGTRKKEASYLKELTMSLRKTDKSMKILIPRQNL